LTAVRISEQKLADGRLQKMASEVVNAQENERKRVSTELHDGISQLLVSARYGLDLAKSNAVNSPSITEPIDKSMTAIVTAISEIRRISMALRPSILDDMGLATALKSLGSDFTERTGIEVIVEAENIGSLLSDMEKTTLYRIAQEALTNVAKHSNATDVMITLEKKKHQVALKVTDNGNGLQFNQVNFNESRLGINNMRERIETHNGRLKLLNEKSGGLCVIATLPIGKIKRSTLQHKAAA
ncbi:MAG: ATP-binding protein, partial [Salaquimonas sp.]